MTLDKKVNGFLSERTPLQRCVCYKRHGGLPTLGQRVAVNFKGGDE